MPELPEVETVVRSLARQLVGSQIVAVDARVSALRLPVQLAALRRACCGRTITGLRRRAKYILVDLAGDLGLVLHLGMTGAFRIQPASAPASVHERVVWRLRDGRTWRFVDPRRFGSVQVCRLPADGSDPEVLAGLGPEPLAAGFDGAVLHGLTRGRERPIKTLIMDQAVVVGVGNIYASEALFRAGLRPQRRSRTLSRPQAGRLAEAIQEVLSAAIVAGGTTIDDFRDAEGHAGRFKVDLAVYGRAGEACLRCGPGHTVRRLVQSGRSSYYCPGCQR